TSLAPPLQSWGIPAPNAPPTKVRRMGTRRLVAASLIALSGFASIRSVSAESGEDASAASIPLPRDGVVRGDRPAAILLPTLGTAAAYSVTVSLDRPDRLAPDARCKVQVLRDDKVVIEKNLHDGDPDL